MRMTAVSLLLVGFAVFGTAKRFILTPENEDENDEITILYNNKSVDVDSSEWKVTFATQQSYDLLLQLNEEWGFNEFSASNITIIINGTNYNPDDGDLLIVFSWANNEYFSVVIRNEDTSNNYKVYPEPFSLLAQTNVTEMISVGSPDRYTRISNNDQWQNPSPSYKGQAEWPLTIHLQNDPTNNILTYSYNTPLNVELYSVSYSTSFLPNNGMDIYIMSDGIGESFGIFSFDIECLTSFATTTTTNPPSADTTSSSTTQYPTHSPTYFPTFTTFEFDLDDKNLTESDEFSDIDTTTINAVIDSHDSHDSHDEYHGSRNVDDVRMASTIAGILTGSLCIAVCLLILFLLQSQKETSKKKYKSKKSKKNQKNKSISKSKTKTKSKSKSKTKSFNDSPQKNIEYHLPKNNTMMHSAPSNTRSAVSNHHNDDFVTIMTAHDEEDGIDIDDEDDTKENRTDEEDDSKAEEKEGELITNAFINDIIDISTQSQATTQTTVTTFNANGTVIKKSVAGSSRQISGSSTNMSKMRSMEKSRNSSADRNRRYHYMASTMVIHDIVNEVDTEHMNNDHNINMDENSYLHRSILNDDEISKENDMSSSSDECILEVIQTPNMVDIGNNDE